MSLSRRNFLKSGALTALSAGCLLSSFSSVLGQGLKHSTPVSSPGAPRKIRRGLLGYYRKSAFEPYVGSTFRVNTGWGRTIDLTLANVSEYRPHPDTRITLAEQPETESFSLLFKSSERLPEFSAIHSLDHDALGRFDLFLGYNKLEDGTILYEAVFNRLI